MELTCQPQHIFLICGFFQHRGEGVGVLHDVRQKLPCPPLGQALEYVAHSTGTSASRDQRRPGPPMHHTTSR